MIRHSRHRDSFPAGLAVVATLLGLGAASPTRASPALARTTATRAAEDPLVWPQGPAVATDGVDAALAGAGLRSRDFGPLRARLVDEAAAEATAIRAALAEVEQRLGAARAGFLAQDYAAMIVALTTAEAAAIAALPAGPACAATLWEIEFQLGLGLLTRAQPGDAERARARFALALALDEARRPVPGLYGPDVGLAFVQAVDEAARRPARPLQRALSPVDATVTIDCRALTPEAALRPGLHLVRVDAPGHRGRAEPLELDATLTVTLSPTRELQLGGWWQRGALDPASASARAAVHAFSGATRIVWLAETDAEARHVARLIVDGAVKRVARADRAGDAVVQALLVEAPPAPAQPRRTRRTGLWLGLAGAALGSVALGLGLGLGLREPTNAHLQLIVR